MVDRHVCLSEGRKDGWVGDKRGVFVRYRMVGWGRFTQHQQQAGYTYVSR